MNFRNEIMFACIVHARLQRKINIDAFSCNKLHYNLKMRLQLEIAYIISVIPWFVQVSLYQRYEIRLHIKCTLAFKQNLYSKEMIIMH